MNQFPLERIWPIINGQVAIMSTTPTVQDPAETTKDLDRFREQLRGVPGPYAYAMLLGLEAPDAATLLRAIESGISYGTFERFRRNTSLSLDQLIDIVRIPRRTLTRRKAEGRFPPDESDRVLRVARLFGKALQLFEGDRAAALDWLTSAQLALGGSVPLELARTELGAQEAERLMSRLEHGVFP
jgi:putative toxin-antitoxin system antitoxin component (TIGR02293 family)